MSSIQHQLIEQCVTRLRSIVEALDNIHDNTPHRWSTDLDEVHSSAESLLAMIKDQAPARSETSFEEWLANELEGEDGQPVPAAVCDIALARRAFNHWPKLEQPAKVGAIRFHAGLSSRLVVEAAQRAYEYKATPEQEAERIERLQAFREQLDPLNLAPHAEAFNEAPAEALKSEQAEAERPEVVAVMESNGAGGKRLAQRFPIVNVFVGDELMTVAQYERIVGALRAENAKLEKELAMARDAALKGDDARHAAGGMEMEIQELRENVAKLKKELRSRWTYASTQSTNCAGCGEHKHTPLRVDWMGGYVCLTCIDEKLEELHGAQVQHGLPDDDTILQIFADNAEHSERGGEHGYCIVRKQHALKIARELLAATPGTEVPQAWLDVQAERKRQIEAEGWTPEHDDAHSHGQMARAAACYALAGSSAPNDGTAALLVSLAWPWDEQWWKPTSARRDLVKACALALAEIERLDRAGISQNPQPGATTASS